MKRFFAGLLSIALSVCFCLSVFAAGMGDVIEDGNVTAGDARAILRAAVGLETLSAEAAARADMDLDGAVTAADARLALRTAVGLEQTDGKTYETQFDVLKSGHFYAEMNVRDKYGTVPMRLALTKDSLFVDFTLEGTSMRMLSNDSGVYFVDEANKCYAAFSDDLMAIFADSDEQSFDPLDMFVSVPVFSWLPDLSSTAYYRGTYNGEPCDCYLIIDETEKETRTVYMDGPRLLAITMEDRFGEVETEIIFQQIMSVIPSKYIELPDGYAEVDFFEFILVNYPELLEEALRDD